MTSYTLLTTACLIGGGAFCLPFSAVADSPRPIPVESVKPLVSTTGTVQDLTQLSDKNRLEWPWAVGGSVEETINETESNSYQIKRESYVAPPSVDERQAEKDWQQSNQGDAVETPALVPFVNF